MPGEATEHCARLWRNFAVSENIRILVTDNNHLLHYINNNNEQHCTQHYLYKDDIIQFVNEEPTIIKGK